MIERKIKKEILQMSKKFPVIIITGPRQSGKTTLVKDTFPNYTYITLEDPDKKELAIDDPKGFLQTYAPPIIIDEAQNVPKLFSYIQGIVDENKTNGQYILTGSRQITLMEEVSQSLAGRTMIYTLLPFSYNEELKIKKEFNLNSLIYSGLYPRIHDQNIPPFKWFTGYVKTYLEKDVRDIINIGDLSTFQKFLKLCAGRSGQILNLSSLANDSSCSVTTAKRWLSVLEATSIIFLLQPYYKNFSKRIIKSPKLYFFDTGLACYLLGIKSAEDLSLHTNRGNLFESFIITEFYKKYCNLGETPPIYYWQNKTGKEVDLILDEKNAKAIEIKSSQTIHAEMYKNLYYWQEQSSLNDLFLIYAGTESIKKTDITINSWNNLF